MGTKKSYYITHFAQKWLVYSGRRCQMKKIMFNDQYGLTLAVLNGRKTMTRREESFLRKLTYTYGQQGMGTRIEVLPCGEVRHYRKDSDSFIVIGKSRFQVGEVVAVAQSYETMANSGYLDIMLDEKPLRFKKEYVGAGYTNKMFTKADLLPHQIRITDIKVERLQDISDDDCLKEGIINCTCNGNHCYYYYEGNAPAKSFHSPQDAFSDLIDKVSGKGTWEKNPFCFCYEFKLIK